MNDQKDINEKMRAILIDWLVDVQIKFKLFDETLFLTINIVDRYLSLFRISREILQLVGIAAMLIACKYEEIYPPEIADFVYITDQTFPKAKILEMEGRILTSLSFKLTFTSALRFLNRYAEVHDTDPTAYCFARYLIELALVEYKMLKYAPSYIAISALYLACKATKKIAWSGTLAEISQYSEQEVRVCARDLFFVYQNGKMSLRAVYRKFSHPKFLEVSKLMLEKNEA